MAFGFFCFLASESVFSRYRQEYSGMYQQLDRESFTDLAIQ